MPNWKITVRTTPFRAQNCWELFLRMDLHRTIGADIHDTIMTIFLCMLFPNTDQKASNLCKLFAAWTEIATYIIKYITVASIPIAWINSIKPLGKLDITNLPCHLGIHHKTHCFKQSFAVIYILVTIKIQNINPVCKNRRHSNLQNIQMYHYFCYKIKLQLSSSSK